MASASLVPSRAGKYVTFQIGRRYFAIAAHRVRNVMSAKDVTAVESPLLCLRGVLQVHGRLVPVVDIRARLELPEKLTHPEMSVVLVQLQNGSGLSAVGIIVDRASDVVVFRESEIRGDIGQLRQHGRPYGRPKTILDVDRLFTAEELATLRAPL